MSGLLASGISELFGAVFGGIYLDGTLKRKGPATDDGKGNLTPLDPAGVPVKVQIDVCTEAMRLTEGYTGTDVRLIILQEGVTGGDINSDCSVTVDGKTYECAAPITSDPARSYWETRGSL